jgi:Predicted DNA-binding protein with PD1-like DNA-binding motif
MQYKQDGDTYIVYIEQEEAIMETLTLFCKEKRIYNAQLSGIGAIKEIEVGAYDLENQEYLKTNLFRYMGINLFSRKCFAKG